jgi:hypothetical protein
MENCDIGDAKRPLGHWANIIRHNLVIFIRTNYNISDSLKTTAEELIFDSLCPKTETEASAVILLSLPN